MCVIAVCETQRPDLKTLLKCETENPHGGGIAWRENGVVKFKKGIDAKEILTISNRVELPFVIHFRIATAGGQSPKMCHPFPIGGSVKMHGNANAVLFHNGHWGDWEDVFLHALVAGPNRRLPLDDISDTRALSMMIGWYGKNLLKLIKGQRFVYFSPSELETHGHWTTINGIHYSNTHWNTNYNWRTGNWGDGDWACGYGNHGGYTYSRGQHQTTPAVNGKSTAMVPMKSAEESATVFQSAKTTAAAALGVTEQDLDDLEKRHGIKVDSKGNLISYSDGAEGVIEVELEDDKVTVGTFGPNKEPIKVPNS